MGTPALGETPRCANCNHRIDGTPWAFAIDDMRFDAWLRFCTEACLDAYEAKETLRIGDEKGNG